MTQGIDPRTGDPVGEPVPETVDLGPVLAAAAAAAGPWAASAPAERARLLRALADRLDAAAGELVPLAAAESGLPDARLVGEVARTSGQLRLFAEVALDGAYLEVILDPADPALTPPRPDLRRWLEPLGPVLVYAASNFPFAFSVLGGDTASALAAGCPVVVKAHPSHPGLSVAVAELAAGVLAELGLPAGLLGLVVGDDAGVAALRDPRVRAAGFTGSTGGGRFLAGVAADRPDPVPFFGELGSINPAVVTPAAVRARGGQVAAGFVGSMSLGTGQFCTKPGLLFLPRGHGLDEALAAAVAAVAPAPMLNARIAGQLRTGLSELDGRDDVRPVVTAAPTDGAWGAPALYRTTAAAVAADPAGLTAEHFGPVALLVEYDGAADLTAALGAVEGSLTATVHSEPDDDLPVADLVRLLAARAGRVVHDGWPTGVAVSWAMQHGGPWPATTAPGHTSVGATAIRRWLRPVCYQDLPAPLLPVALRDGNPWHLPRRLDGDYTRPDA
jgi:NADP-dependent aldehyde dehydrogenase